jgi:methyltransferase
MNHQYLPNLWIAIPDSSLLDEQTSRDKAIKICQFARACAIFRVSKIYIYHDSSQGPKSEDLLLLTTVLRYLDTPQYLRKILFPHSKELAYAGILHPLSSPHHQKLQRIEDVKIGDIRVGVILQMNGHYFADVGLGSLVLLDTRKKGYTKKINVKITSTKPILKGVEASTDDIGTYWGYEVFNTRNLGELIEMLPNTHIILTSRKGRYITNVDPEIFAFKSSDNVLIVFGSPKRDLDEIFASEGEKIKKSHMMLNTFPLQATRTVRLEEAILGSLALFNYILLKQTVGK